jgi:hypothetical protein
MPIWARNNCQRTCLAPDLHRGCTLKLARVLPAAKSSLSTRQRREIRMAGASVLGGKSSCSATAMLFCHARGKHSNLITRDVTVILVRDMSACAYFTPLSIMTHNSFQHDTVTPPAGPCHHTVSRASLFQTITSVSANRRRLAKEVWLPVWHSDAMMVAAHGDGHEIRVLFQAQQVHEMFY